MEDFKFDILLELINSLQNDSLLLTISYGICIVILYFFVNYFISRIKALEEKVTKLENKKL